MDEKHSIGEEREASPNKIDYLSSEGESSVWLTLSPIVELNETSIVDSTISDIQGEEISFTEPGQDVNHERYEEFILKNDEYSNNLSIRPSSLQSPEIPPNDLRNSLSKLECQYEYLKNEHEDLIEFTRLEKQILHEDCVSKEKMKSLEDEFSQVNTKVYALMQENEDLVTKLECKDEEMKELNTKLTSCVHYKREMGRKMLEIGQKLKEDLQMDVKDILKNNPSFELLLRKEDPHIEIMPSRSDFDETENILQTLKEISDLLIFQRNELKLKNDSLYLNIESSNKIVDKLSRQLQDTETILRCTNNEKDKLLEKINIANIKDKENMNSLHTTQNELKETLTLLEMVNKDNKVMQDKICDINNQKDELLIIFNELLNQVNCLNKNCGIKDVISEFEKNDSFLETINVVCSSNIRSIIYEILDKVKTWFNLFEEDRNHLLSNVKDFSNTCLQNSKELKLKVDILDNTVESIFKKINSLHNVFNSYCNNKICVEEKFIKMQEENKNLSEAIVILDNKLKDSLILLEKSEDENIKLQNDKRLINSEESSVQIDLYSILKEVEISIDMWDYTKGVKDLFNKIKQKENVYNDILFFFGLSNQSFFFRLTEKLERKIDLCDKELNKLVSVESTNRIIQLENDGHVKEKSKSHQEMEELKYLLNTYENENICLKNDIEDLKSKYCTKANDIQSYLKEQKCFGQCFEQLNILREKMIVEITSLNFEESKEDLQKYSSVEIFSKLMQNIIKKEAEITLDLQNQLKGEIELAQNELDKFHHKHKSQESWINSLENENEKMNKEVVNLKNNKEELENKIKYLSTSFKYSSSEVSLLKNKLSELATENDAMRNAVHNFKEAVESEKEIAQSLKIQISDLREELISKTQEIANLKLLCDVKKPDITKDIALENNYFSKTRQLSCSGENIALFDSNYLTVDSNYHLVDNRIFKNSTEIETKTEEVSTLRINTQIIANIENEKEIIMQALAARSLNNVKNLNISNFVLKDVFVGVIKKVSEMESAHAEEISHLQNCVIMTSKELAELKANLEQLYKDLSLDIPLSGIDGFMEPWKDSISLKIELDLVKEECELINKRSLEIENSAKTGHCVVQTLRHEFQVIKSEICKKEKIIDELKKTISTDQKKYCDKKTEFVRQINKLNLQNAHTKEQVNQTQSQLSVITSYFTDSIINFPVEICDMKSKMDYINDIFKQKAHQDDVIDSLISETNFFSVQCSLMLSYIKSKDHCLEVTEKEKEHLIRRIDLLDYQISDLKKSLDEKNIFVSNVITELPKKTRTLNEAVELVQEMCIEYGHLNKSELSFLEDCKNNAEQITVLQNEIKVANNVIESLKSELNNCEDHIRNLRSELRSVRSKQRRQEIGHSIMRDDKSEVGIQTETLCCTNLNEQLEKGKQILEDRCCQITSLKLQLQGNVKYYKKKVSDLEQALVKAKKRIFNLQSESIEYKTYNANLIESYNTYKEELSKAYKEIEILKTQMQTNNTVDLLR